MNRRMDENHDAHVRAWVNNVQDRALAEVAAVAELMTRTMFRNLPPDRKWFSLAVPAPRPGRSFFGKWWRP